MMKRNVIHNESCVTGLKKLEEGCIDMVCTSPPYDDLRTYNDSSKWDFGVFEQVAKELARVIKPGGVIMWNVGDATIDGSETLSSFRQALYFVDECGLKMHDTMIYQKSSSSYPAHEGSVRYSQVFEYCFVLSKGKPSAINLIKDRKNRWAGTTSFGTRTTRTADGELKKSGNKVKVQEFGFRDNIWLINNSFGFTSNAKDSYSHPAIMPYDLALGHIKSWSNPGDLVLDPFMGSGTTALAAYQLDRDYIGFEIDEEYWSLCQDIVATKCNSVFDKVA